MCSLLPDDEFVRNGCPRCQKTVKWVYAGMFKTCQGCGLRVRIRRPTPDPGTDLDTAKPNRSSANPAQNAN